MRICIFNKIFMTRVKVQRKNDIRHLYVNERVRQSLTHLSYSLRENLFRRTSYPRKESC